MSTSAALRVHTPAEVAAPLPAKLAGTIEQFAAIWQHPEAKARIAPLLAPDDEYDRIVAVAMRAARKTPALLRCTPTSILDAASTIVGWKLEIGDTAHLVPYGETCTPLMDYKGMGQLLIASKVVRAIEGWCVYEKEVDRGDFKVTAGSESRIEHRPWWRGADRGPMAGAYTMFFLPNNRSTFKLMSVEEIEEIRQTHSKQWKVGPLKPWYAIKTTIRQARKVLGSTPALARAFSAFEQEESLASAVEMPMLASGGDPERSISHEAFSAPALVGDSRHETAEEEPVPSEQRRPAPVRERAPLSAMTLDQALVVRLRGASDKWGGHGGKVLADVPPSMIKAARGVFAEKIKSAPDDALAHQVRALDLVHALRLEEAEKEQCKLGLEMEQSAAQESEAKEAQPGDDGPSHSAAGEVTPPPASSGAAASPFYGFEPYPEPDFETLTPGQLKARAILLLGHASMKAPFTTGTKEQLNSGLSVAELRKVVRQLEAMIAGAPPKKRGATLGNLPGDPA